MKCTCPMTDPKYWTTHYGAVDPASQYEWDPDCPQHGDTPIERETADSLGYTAWGVPTNSG